MVIASSEDHPGSVIVPRLIAAAADLTRVHIVQVQRDGLTGDIALPDDLDDVAIEVARVGARLLIIDPLVAHMPMQVDTHKAQHVRRVLAPLSRLAEQACLAVVAVVHFNGAPSTDVRSRISGSKALRDASRSVLVCGVDPADESRYVMLQDKASLGPRPTTGRAYRIEGATVERDGEKYPSSRVVWLGNVKIDGRGLLAGPDAPEERTDRDDAVFLRSCLADGPRPSDELKAGARREVVKDRTLHRARRDLGVVVTRHGFPAVSTWSLPTEPTADQTPTRTLRTGGLTTGVRSEQLDVAQLGRVAQLL